MRILVIDDYRPHGESLQELLQTRGHEALYAESYNDAESFLDSLRFDLAFLDYDMPQLKGPAVVTKLSERDPSLRSVIVSANAAAKRHAEMKDLLFLAKPVSTLALYQCLERVERDRAGFALVLRPIFPLAPQQPDHSSLPSAFGGQNETPERDAPFSSDLWIPPVDEDPSSGD